MNMLMICRQIISKYACCQNESYNHEMFNILALKKSYQTTVLCMMIHRHALVLPFDTDKNIQNLDFQNKKKHKNSRFN